MKRNALQVSKGSLEENAKPLFPDTCEAWEEYESSLERAAGATISSIIIRFYFREVRKIFKQEFKCLQIVVFWNYRARISRNLHGRKKMENFQTRGHVQSYVGNEPTVIMSLWVRRHVCWVLSTWYSV